MRSLAAASNIGKTTVDGGTIDSNHATGADAAGGGIYTNGRPKRGGGLILTGTVVSGNEANGTGASGGGIRNDGATRLTNVTVAETGPTTTGAASSTPR